MKRDICIPISTAQSIAESLDLRQVIIVAWDGSDTHVATYGGSVTDSANAARGGNRVKQALGWPDNLDTESPKVLALQAQIAGLKAQLDALVPSQSRMWENSGSGWHPTTPTPE
jgi:hypothetical protein